MSREDPQLKIRLPLELKDKISDSASEIGRSINSEVVARLEQSFDDKGVELRENEMVIDKTLYNELIGMRKDLLKMSRFIYEGLAPMYEDIKVLPCLKPTRKTIKVGGVVRLNFTFGDSNNSRYGNFKVVEFDGIIGKGELLEVISDLNYFEDYDDRIGKIYKFTKDDVFDVQ